VTDDDLRVVAKATRKGKSGYNRMLLRLDQARRNLQLARISGNDRAAASPGVRRLLAAWDAYLRDVDTEVASMSAKLNSGKLTFRRSDDLLDAARGATDEAGYAVFDRKRRRFRAEVQRLSGSLNSLNTPEPDKRPVRDAYTENDDARALVDAANKRAPHGSLAELVQ
jgi:hypothetical protein